MLTISRILQQTKSLPGDTGFYVQVEDKAEPIKLFPTTYGCKISIAFTIPTTLEYIREVVDFWDDIIYYNSPFWEGTNIYCLGYIIEKGKIILLMEK